MIWQRSAVAKEEIEIRKISNYGCKNSFKSSRK